MKSVAIPIFDSRVYVYWGADEFSKFEKRASKADYEVKGSEMVAGMCCGSFIWVGDCSNETLLHEIIHTVDYLIDEYGLEGTEVRAYLVCFIYEKTKIKKKTKSRKKVA